jgi:hypothetical protein
LAELAERDLKKHVAAVHISNKLSLTQRKASNVLLFNAYDDLLTKEQHRIRIRDLAAVIGCESHNLEPLKDALRGLARTVLEWNILDHEGREKEWGATTLLAQATIRGGYCTYAYSPELREKLYNPQVYARINLSLQRRFSSGHALALYENCARFRNVGTTGWIDVATFRQLLGINEGTYYHDFRKLNAKVIKPAVTQVNTTSDLLLQVDYQRQKRRVVSLRFQVSENPQLSLFGQQPTAANQEKNSLPASAVSPELQDKQHFLFLRLISFGLTEKQAAKVLEDQEQDYIEEILTVVEKDFDASKVDNLSAYTLAALRDDYRPKEPPLKKEGEEVKAREQARLKQKQAAQTLLEGLHKEFEEHRLQTALAKLTEKRRSDLESRFVEKIMNGREGDTLTRRLYKAHGLEHKSVASMFRHFARQELLGAVGEGEFLAFVASQGHDLAAIQADIG